MIATVRNASKPSRKMMMSALSMGFLFAELHRRGGDHLHAIGRVGLLALFAAVGADAEDLQVVKGRRELLALADLELALFERVVVELDHRAARGADEVVVVRIAGDVLVVVVV